MASGKQSPRQKMINMMYLVLTALLAMNVSKSILDSFVVIDQGQIITRNALSDKLDGQMNTFSARADENPTKYGANYQKAKQVQDAAKDLVTHINKIKAKTIALTDGIEMDEVYDAVRDTVLALKLVSGKDNYDVNTRIMYGTGEVPNPEMDDNTAGENPEGYNYRAAELRKRLETFRDLVVANFNDNPTLVASTQKMFNFEGIVDVEGNTTDWETINFYHNPIAASTSLLSKIQSDVLSVESDAIGAIFDEVEGKTYKFNKLTEAVIPEATYVTQGGTFNAQVFLAAFDDTNPPEILLGAPGVKFDSLTGKLSGESVALEKEGAKGIVKLPAGGLGPQHREGVIIFKPSGMAEKRVGFDLDYTVAAPALVVSPTKMNVFYRGLANPVSISVAGFKDSDLSPSMTNGKLSKGADGWVVSGLGSGKDAVVSCRVKNVPDPVAFFGGKGAGDSSIGKGELRAAQGVAARLQNFEFEGVKFTVQQFKLTMMIKGQPIEKVSRNAYLTPDMKNMIGGAKSGQRVFIENIRAVGPDGNPRKLGSITLKVI
jgi:gliding motility-associated protein GldM